MSKNKLMAAKELIQEKRYAEARAILKTVDHPTAREWLAKLDKIAPEKQESALKKLLMPRRGRSRLYWIGFAVFACGLFYVCSIFGQTIGIIPTTQQLNVTRTVEASLQVAARATEDSIRQMTADAQATVIALTPPTATATITETPIPTNTQPPSPTPVPTQAPMGTRSNPFGVGVIGAIRDGRFTVNRIERNATARVQQMNMFNEEPNAGQEWALVNVTFYCDLSADETCNTSVMQLELVGTLGKVYDYELLAVLDNKFGGEVFGGGQTSGDIGFIIDTSDTNLSLAVNDMGDRIFFATGA
jgi:hypothetical protein